jgi:hypothetical protein
MNVEDRLPSIAGDLFLVMVVIVLLIGAALLFTPQQQVRLGCGGHTTAPNGQLVCREP